MKVRGQSRPRVDAGKRGGCPWPRAALLRALVAVDVLLPNGRRGHTKGLVGIGLRRRRRRQRRPISWRRRRPGGGNLCPTTWSGEESRRRRGMNGPAVVGLHAEHRRRRLDRIHTGASVLPSGRRSLARFGPSSVRRRPCSNDRASTNGHREELSSWTFTGPWTPECASPDPCRCRNARGRPPRRACRPPGRPRESTGTTQRKGASSESSPAASRCSRRASL